MSDINQTLIIACSVQGYLMLSVKEKFEDNGYKVIVVKPDMDEISRVKDAAKAILLYGDSDWEDRKPLMVYLKDLATEDNIMLFATGSREELDTIERGIGAPNIRYQFVRPINVNDLVNSVNQYIQLFSGPNRKKILVVDDSGAMLRNVKSWLEDEYDVALANSGAMAIKYLTANRPDLILLDYEMPIVDGRQVLGMIRAEPAFADIPVIFLTGKGDKESVMKVMELKPEGYLLKTLEPIQIINAIDDFFEKQKLQGK